VDAVERAIKYLERVERCGCWTEPAGEGIDPDHKADIKGALRVLRQSKNRVNRPNPPVLRTTADGTQGMKRGV
jgi:hypothetical protein